MIQAAFGSLSWGRRSRASDFRAKTHERTFGLSLGRSGSRDLCGDDFADRAAHSRRTYTPRVIDWKNGFAGLFRLDDQIGLLSRAYRDPVLVASTDGVGTKLKLAFATGRHSTVGIDLVAMSVNDCLCAGAEPLFFLDYVAMSRDDPDLTSAIVAGISDGLHRRGLRPAGRRDGDSAGFLQGGEYDLAGFLRRRGRAKAYLERQRHPAGRQGDRPGQLGTAFERLQPGAEDRLRAGRASAETFVPELGRTVARRAARADAALRAAGEDCLPTLPRQADRAWNRPHHGRGTGREPRPHPAGWLRDPLRRGSWTVPKVFPWLQSLGSVERRGDGSRLQHGHRPGDRRRGVLCRGDRHDS